MNAPPRGQSTCDRTKGFVDAIYAKLLVVEDKDNDGNGGQRQRRSLANATLVACRRAWIVARHAQEKSDQSLLANGFKGPRSGRLCTKDQLRRGKNSSLSCSREKAWV
jgi:hypothetical protein